MRKIKSTEADMDIKNSVIEKTDDLSYENKLRNLKDIFLIFFKIGAFTIGGGLAMLPVIQREMEQRNWINEQEFLDMVTLSQAIPGPIVVNMSVNLGYKLRGMVGALIAVAGCVIPSFIVTLLIAFVFRTIATNPQVMAMFKGIRAAVTGIIMATLLKLIKASFKSAVQMVFAAGAFLILIFLKVSPGILICIAVITGIFFMRREEKA